VEVIWDVVAHAAIVDHQTACIATAGRNDKEFLKFRKWHRIMAQLVGQHAVRDFRSHKKSVGRVVP